MATLGDSVFDNGLNKLVNDADEIHITNTEATDYTDATSTSSLGSKSSPSITGPADRSGGGREVTVGAISDGSVSADGTANYYAIVDTVNSLLLATGPLGSSQQVYNGNTWTTGSFNIGIPDPA